MTKIYDRNHNELSVGQQVMISTTGEIDKVEQIIANNLTNFEAEHQPTVQVKAGKFAPIDLIRIGH